MVLALAFMPVVAWFAYCGLRGEALVGAIAPVAVWPGTLAFVAIFGLTTLLAGRDGLSWGDLGWCYPTMREVFLGVSVGVGVATLNGAILYPLLQAAQPSFDPLARALSLPAVSLLLGTAIIAEESLYRGYAFIVLRRRYGAIIAWVGPAILYPLLTPGPELPLKLWALGFGFVLGRLRLGTRSLVPVMLAHALVSLGPRLLA